jgi:hypothetical protein
VATGTIGAVSRIAGRASSFNRLPLYFCGKIERITLPELIAKPFIDQQALPAATGRFDQESKPQLRINR